MAMLQTLRRLRLTKRKRKKRNGRQETVGQRCEQQRQSLFFEVCQ
jgi:hypothetical protein